MTITKRTPAPDPFRMADDLAKDDLAKAERDLEDILKAPLSIKERKERARLRADLRRLREINAELLEALKAMALNMAADKHEYRDCFKAAVAAITKAEAN